MKQINSKRGGESHKEDEEKDLPRETNGRLGSTRARLSSKSYQTCQLATVDHAALIAVAAV